MTQEEALKVLWQKTKLCHHKLEKNIAENYINFLRQVATYYLTDSFISIEKIEL